MMFLTFALGNPSKPDSTSIFVELTGIPSDQGVVRIALFDKSDGFTHHEFAVQKARFQAKAGTVNWTFDGVNPGRYAVAAYHDENDNGELDTNFLGIPTESYGFSNNVTGTFGPPSFQAASFEVAAGVTSIKFQLR